MTMPRESLICTEKNTTQDEYRKKCDAFVEQHYKKLRSYALFTTHRDVDRAEDLLQRVIIILLEGRTEVTFEKGSLKYIQNMIYNQYRNDCTKERIRMQHNYTLCTSEESPKGDHSYSGEFKEDLLYLLKHLTERERQLIEWQLDGLTMTQMIPLMDTPLSKGRIHQIIKGAREKMRVAAEALLQAETSSGQG
jgi:RNA polymerase sigma factor (sigma-70 family)